MILYRLDPLGGMAGDMFAAACLDALPYLRSDLLAVLENVDLPEGVKVELAAESRGGMAGTRFLVHLPEQEEESSHHHSHQHHDHHHHHHDHRSFTEIRALLERYDLSPAVRARARSIFTRLAEAEAAVHGASLETISFHEVGGWDSIVDVIAAAWLIEAMGPATWVCGPLPMGSGRVMSAHGPLPVPAPATVRLLEGLPLIDDGFPGERVTPTGAAILAELQPRPRPTGVLRLSASGAGLGTREIPGLANVLRLTCFEAAEATEAGTERLVEMAFDLDDQSPEDLALALEGLRELPGVLDVIQVPGFGKKGRLSIQIQVLLRPESLEAVAAYCLSETTTLGLRWRDCWRFALPREVGMAEGLAVKTVRRPDGREETKPEADDLKTRGLMRREREAFRAGLNQEAKE